MTYSIISRQRGKLMGVAALWIYVFHVMPAPAYWEAQGLEKVWWYFRNAGFCGVDMFLFVSGLGLAYHLERHPVRDWRTYLKFLEQRFFKIYVTFLPFTVIYALLDGWGIGMLVKRLLCLDQFSGNLYNFCWYVCCILLLYLLTPALHALLKKRPVAASVLGVGYLLALYALRGNMRADLYAIGVRLPVFALGLWTARFSLEDRKLTGWDWPLWSSVLLVGFVLSYAMNAGLVAFPLPSCNALVNVLLAPALCVLLAAAFQIVDAQTWFLPAAKWLSFFGSISFEFYLLQEWYVRRGLHVLPAQGKLQHVLLFCVMTALSVALQKLASLVRTLCKKG